MKKSSSVYCASLIGLVLLFTIAIPTQIYEAYATNQMTISVGSLGTATRGETITVPISVNNNPGFTAIGLVVTYDPNVLEIVDVTDPVAAMPLNSQFALTATQGTQWINLVNTSFINWNGNGNFVNIRFNVRPSAPAGLSNVNLSYTSTPDGTPANANGDIIRNFSLISGSVNIVDNYANTSTPVVATPTSVPLAPTPIAETYPAATPLTFEPVQTNTAQSITQTNPTSTPYEFVYDGYIYDGEGDSYTSRNTGGFYGNPYADTDNSYIISESETELPKASVSATSSSFGKVPQTGGSGITGSVIGMCISFISSVILYIYLFRHKYMRDNDGKA